MRTQTQAPGGCLQLQDVNTTFLDTLVLKYLEAEDFVEDEADQEAQEQLCQRLAALAAYQHLQRGNVHAALDIAAHYCPTVLEDQRLSFRLKRQHFIELLRQETAAGDSAALECARRELAPLALDAYPEAFLDFKKTLLMLVDTQQQQQQTQTQQQLGGQHHQQQHQQHHQEWSLGGRQQLAETLYHTMVLQMGCRAPSLSLLLRYLLLLYGQHTASATSAASAGGSGSRGINRSSSQQQQQVQQLVASRGGRVADGLLLEGRDEGPLPPDVSGQQPRASDVQALMAALALPRRECEDALKLTGGDVAAALAHQLGRLRLDVAAVDALVWEYATARGLLEPAEGPEVVAAAIAAAAAATANHHHAAAAAGGTTAGGEGEGEDGMDIDGVETPDASNDNPAAAAAVASREQPPPQPPQSPAAAAPGHMPPPANRSAQKRSKAAISGGTAAGDNAGGGSSSIGSGSPFRLQQQQQQQGFAGSAAPPDHQGLVLSVQHQQQQAAAAATTQPGSSSSSSPALNRSASQSPPYKAPRYRRKQTPSRFYTNCTGMGGVDAAAAAAGGGGGDGGVEQQQQWFGGHQLEQVVVLGGNAGDGQAAAAAVGGVGVGGKQGLSPSSSRHHEQQQQQQHAGGAISSKGSPSKRSTAAETPPPPQQQQQQFQVAMVRAASQQQRWQALQQQLKSRALSSASGGGGGVRAGLSGAAAGGGGASGSNSQNGVPPPQQQQQQVEGGCGPEALQSVQRLLQQQQYGEAEAAVERLAGGLWQEQPRLMFELRRCQFAALVASNQLSAALQLARTQLTPLADTHPDLLPAVKASMALLLPTGLSSSSSAAAAAAGGGSSSSAEVLAQRVWEGLLPLLQSRLGIQPPQLVSLLQVLLTAHKAWFVRQRCSDPFAVTLSLNKLLPKPSASTAAAASVLGPSAAGAAGGVGGDRPCSAGRVGAAAAGEAAAGVGGVGAGQGPPQAAAAAAGAAGAAARLAAGAAAAAGGDHPAWEFYGGYGAGVLGGVFAEAMAAGGGAAMAGEGGEEEEEDEEAMRAGDEDDDVPDVDEAAVLQVMEVLELPRGTALELLAEHGGDAQAVIMAVFGG